MNLWGVFSSKLEKLNLVKYMKLQSKAYIFCSKVKQNFKFWRTLKYIYFKCFIKLDRYIKINVSLQLI